ncbi:MAG: DUF1667 domain-containing protein [Bacilli bacterium]|nr:DUF1667 domain-containing protein [Bacilli bacterium]MBN2876574.1 DUF1667 domain-containing protein [Bacilli bacterium]
MKKEFICIVCPRGCHITVHEDGSITGNMCKRGIDYVQTEMSSPKRIVTTTVKTVFSEMPRVPVKTSQPIPKELIMDVMKELSKTTITKPMSMGDVLIENILDTGANIVLTRSCMK